MGTEAASEALVIVVGWGGYPEGPQLTLCTSCYPSHRQPSLYPCFLGKVIQGQSQTGNRPQSGILYHEEALQGREVPNSEVVFK